MKLHRTVDLRSVSSKLIHPQRRENAQKPLSLSEKELKKFSVMDRDRRKAADLVGDEIGAVLW